MSSYTEAKQAKAKELFMGGANCSQAVAGAFQEECGIPLESIFRMASGFGGGMGRMREVCGAVSGMVLVAGILRGPTPDEGKEAKDAHYALIQKLAGQFREQLGSIICRELLGLAPHSDDSPVSTPRTPDFHRKRPCSEIVAIAAGILANELENQNS